MYSINTNTLLIESSPFVPLSHKKGNTALPSYLPNLNAIRAIAALMVVVSHIELKKADNLAAFRNIVGWGGIGVNVFFVLSGFLITYLLLKERLENTTIRIKDFYIRRILRIWPLYFAVLFSAYFLFRFVLTDNYSGAHYSMSGLLLNVFFLTNVTFITGLTPFCISTIWSIGVEEQFYIFWPWLMKRRKEKLLGNMIGVILLIPVLKLFFVIMYHGFGIEAFSFMSHLVSTARFDLMATGGVFAYIGVYKRIKLANRTITASMLQTKKVQLVALFLFLISVVVSMANMAIDLMATIAGLSSAVLIFNMALNKHCILKLESKAGNYLGQISYSIYLLHMPLIYLVNEYITPHLVTLNVVSFNVCLYVIVLSLTVICASLSYHFYEKRFLKYKRKFIHI